MSSSAFAFGSGCLFLMMGGLLMFGALMAIGGGIDALGPATALTVPELVVVVALLSRRWRRLGFLLGIAVGAALTGYWGIGAASSASENNALGGMVVIFALLAAAATLMAVGGVALQWREAHRNQPPRVTFSDAD